jgi:O-methyltransferase/methyltransferase family protein
MSNYPINECPPPSPLVAPICDDRLIWEIWLSHYRLPALAVADQIGLFPFLAQSPATVEEVAAGLSLGPLGAESLLSLVSALGFLVQRQGRFYLTDEARTYLLAESPYYYGNFLQSLMNIPITAKTIREWLENDRAGSIAEPFKTWKSDDMLAEMTAPEIIPTIHAHSFPAAMGMAHNGDFSDVHQLLDVGGGSGCFCIALATRYPNMHFAVMDLPVVCKLAEQYIAGNGLQGQIETITADMFADPWPSGYDGVLFSNVFHDWNLARCLHLAKRSFEILPSGGRIFIHEILLNDTKDGPLVAAGQSMNMLAMGGRQYTARELDKLLRDVGFTDVTVKPTHTYFSLVSASKPV